MSATGRFLECDYRNPDTCKSVRVSVFFRLHAPKSRDRMVDFADNPRIVVALKTLLAGSVRETRIALTQFIVIRIPCEGTCLHMRFSASLAPM